jgi:hypothetical protein
LQLAARCLCGDLPGLAHCAGQSSPPRMRRGGACAPGVVRMAPAISQPNLFSLSAGESDFWIPMVPSDRTRHRGGGTARRGVTSAAVFRVSNLQSQIARLFQRAAGEGLLPRPKSQNHLTPSRPTTDNRLEGVSGELRGGGGRITVVCSSLVTRHSLLLRVVAGSVASWS